MVQCMCDNEAVVSVSHMAHMLSCFFSLEARFELGVVAAHVPGFTWADALSPYVIGSLGMSNLNTSANSSGKGLWHVEPQ